MAFPMIFYCSLLHGLNMYDCSNKDLTFLPILPVVIDGIMNLNGNYLNFPINLTIYSGFKRVTFYDNFWNIKNCSKMTVPIGLEVEPCLVLPVYANANADANKDTRKSVAFEFINIIRIIGPIIALVGIVSGLLFAVYRYRRAKPAVERVTFLTHMYAYFGIPNDLSKTPGLLFYLNICKNNYIFFCSFYNSRSALEM